MSSNSSSQDSSSLSEEAQELLSDLRRHPGWQLYQQVLREHLGGPVWTNLRSASEPHKIFKAQGELDMLEKVLVMPQDLLNQDGRKPR